MSKILPALMAAIAALAVLVLPCAVVRAEMLILEGGTTGEFEITQRRVFARPGPVLSRFSFRYANPADVDTPTLKQKIRSRRVSYSPKPESVENEVDRFGNRYTVVTWRSLAEDAVVTERYTVVLDTRLANTPSRASYPLPASSVTHDAARYLEPTSLVESESVKVKRLAASLTRGSVTEQEAAERILNWVVDNVKYRTPIPEYGALWTLSERTGNCQNFSHLSIALLRASGIPARIVGGISLGRAWKVPIEGGSLLQTIGQGGHAWIEVFYPDLGWLPYDAQQSHLFVGPRHVKQTVGLDSTDVNDSWRAAPTLPRFSEDISAEFPKDEVALSLKETRPGPESYIMTASVAPAVAAPPTAKPALPAPVPAPALPPARPPKVEVPSPPEPSEAPEPTAPPRPKAMVFGNVEFPSLMDFYVRVIEGDAGHKTFDKETAEYVTGPTVYAQGFIVDRPMNLDSVSLAMHKFGGRIGGLWVDVVRDEAGRPGMSGFRSLPLSLDTIRYEPGYRWFDFVFSRHAAESPVLEPGRYWIVLRHTRDAFVSWFYSPGNRYGTPDDTRTTGAGIDFSDVLNLDFNFRVTGRTVP